MERTPAELIFALEAEGARSAILEARWKAERLRFESAEHGRLLLIAERNNFRDRLELIQESEAWKLGSKVSAVALPLVSTLRRLRHHLFSWRVRRARLTDLDVAPRNGPLVSVIIRQPETALPATLLRQTLPRWEALGYCDDGIVLWSEPGSCNFTVVQSGSSDALADALRRCTAPFVATLEGSFPDDPVLLERAAMLLCSRPHLDAVATTMGDGSVVTIRRRGSNGPAISTDAEFTAHEVDAEAVSRLLDSVAWLYPRHVLRNVLILGDEDYQFARVSDLTEAAGRSAGHVTNGYGPPIGAHAFHYRPDMLLPPQLRPQFGVSLNRRCRSPVFVVTGTWSSYSDLIPPGAHRIAVVSTIDQVHDLPDGDDSLRVVSLDAALRPYLRSRGFLTAQPDLVDALSWSQILDAADGTGPLR